ncbi:MAG TPA: DUF2341 domain-containing protein, partial [Candidatus Dormibacteraeota bacterium]|nr:DUF2341 domain-containing protein [Candidatus Dormibacteraeota bacterium]
GGGTLTGYQVHVVLGASFDFTKTQANGADIRFTASDGVTGLPFWIENWNPAASSASLWVKVPMIDAVNGATLYMYYGNSTAVSASSGSSTFDFFDDFSLGSIDATKWTSSGGTWSVVTGTEPNGLTGTIAQGSTVRPPNQILYSSSYSAGDYIFEVNGLQQSGRHWGIGTRVNGPTNFYSTNLYADLNTTNNLYEYKWLNNDGTGTAIRLGATAVGAINPNSWYKLRMAVHSSSIDVYLNDVLKLQTIDDQWTTGGVALFGGENMVANFAYVRARQYATTEPTASLATPAAVTTSQAIVTPGSLSFVNQTVGTTSASQAVVLNNPGSQPLLISNISVTGDYLQTNNCPASLAVGLSCTVNASFSPTAIRTRTGSLTFTDNAPSASQSVALTGIGGITVTLTPRNAAINFTQTQQFTATVAGTSNTAVSWYVDNIAGGSATVGTISSAGFYTPPAAVGSHTVTAISAADTSSTGSATIYISNSSGVLTYHNDNSRTGLNSETALTPSNVNSTQFGKLFSFPVDGQIFAQPLYVPSLTIGSQVHNAVFVATAHDSVYALDADSASPTPLWQTSFINPAAGVTAIPCSEAATGNCAVATPEFGIISTPVIDATSGTLYVVAATKEVAGATTNYVYRLHALSLTTGAEKFGGPTVIQPTVPGITFTPKLQLQREGLLLVNGVVYVGFGSHGDLSTWYGWLVGYNATTLQQVMAFNTAPKGGQAAIWQAGCAPAVDASGNIYFMTGNGPFSADTGGTDYGDTLLKLNANGTVADYFTPSNQAMLNIGDLDLGSGGQILLPDQTGTYPHLLIAAGKEGKIYVINRDNMGKYSSVKDTSLQSLSGLGQIFSTPAFWNNYVYFVGWNDYLKSFQLNNYTLTQTANSMTKFQYPGATPSITANGNANGIVWVVQADVGHDVVLTTVPNATLRAYNASNVAVELYNSGQAANGRDTAGGAMKFAVPTVVNGKVFVGNSNQLTVYGLLP